MLLSNVTATEIHREFRRTIVFFNRCQLRFLAARESPHHGSGLYGLQDAGGRIQVYFKRDDIVRRKIKPIIRC